MNRHQSHYLIALTVLVAAFLPALAEEPAAKPDDGDAPKVFLDKAPRIVEFQLNRLTNGQLLKVERKTDHAKYKPVYEAILIRPGILPRFRDEAVAALIKLNESDAAAVLAAAVAKIDTLEGDYAAVLAELAGRLLAVPQDKLAARRDELHALATDATNARPRQIAYAALITADGRLDDVWQQAAERDAVKFLLGGAPLIKDAKLLAAIHPKAQMVLADSSDDEARAAAVTALAASAAPAQLPQAAATIAALLAEGKDKPAAAAALRRLPPQHWPKDALPKVAAALLEWLEQTPQEERTSEVMIEASQLGYDIAALQPKDEAAALRKKFAALSVRVIVIKTPNEEMRYDPKYIAVEAGKPVQIVLMNTDSMPHNIVVLKPGKGGIEEIGKASELMQPPADAATKAFIPDSPLILFSSHLVQAGESYRLNFVAPSEPGEYPFLCTFPGHWSRMYGVMVVAPDLEAYLANPKEPADPLGNTRTLVKEWKMEDFATALPTADKGRSIENGRLVFTQAGCVQCHRLGKEGGQVGPDLTEVFKKWKGKREDVLREILEPSKVIDPKYQPYMIETTEGDRFVGLVIAEDDKSITVISNPQNPQPKKMSKDDIFERTKAKSSMMPVGLMNIFKLEEVLDLLAYLEKGGHGGHEHHK